MTPGERAWVDIHDLVPKWWRVGRPTYERGRDRWTVSAISRKYSGRLRAPATVTGEGEDELAALTDLVMKLRELRAIEQRMAIEAKARAAYIGGAEDHSRATLGRSLTQDELKRIIARFAGPPR